MKTTNPLNYILACLLVTLTVLPASRGEPDKGIETPDQLLTAVNEMMKEMNHSAFTFDELTVWLASQAGLTRSKGKLPPRVEKFLIQLTGRQKFDIPVGMWLVGTNDLPLTDDIHSTKKLPLPDYYTFELAIYNVPPGSTDAEGKGLKVTHDSIVVATALGAPK